jgi:hypothetical protein
VGKKRLMVNQLIQWSRVVSFERIVLSAFYDAYRLNFCGRNSHISLSHFSCLDRTNVAQFSAGVEAMGHQLVVMGIRSQGKLGPSSSFVKVLIDLYVDIGDSIALQYGGSEAHKKVTASVSETISGPIGKVSVY